MPNQKGDTEITIPTYLQHETIPCENGYNIFIRSETGTIQIKCRRPVLVKGKFDEDKD